ncbi:hypothetical protein LCGC14_1704780, partial [marine sediment metagenome]
AKRTGSVPQTDALFKRALGSLYSDKQTTIARKRVRSEKDKFDKLRTQPPTKRKGKGLSSRDAQVQAVKAIASDRGIALDGGAEVDF